GRHSARDSGAASAGCGGRSGQWRAVLRWRLPRARSCREPPAPSTPPAGARDHPLALDDRTHEGVWQREIAEAAGGKERLRERAAVDDGVGIQSSEGRNRLGLLAGI